MLLQNLYLINPGLSGIAYGWGNEKNPVILKIMLRENRQNLKQIVAMSVVLAKQFPYNPRHV